MEDLKDDDSEKEGGANWGQERFLGERDLFSKTRSVTNLPLSNELS